LILFLTDLHWGMKKFSKKYYDLQINYFREVVFPFLLENKITNVIHCGDIVDEPAFIDNKILQDLKYDFIDFFEKNLIHLYLLQGNHDIVHRNDGTYDFNKSLAYGMTYVHSISEACGLNIDGNSIGFVPFTETYDAIPKTAVHDFIVGHHDVSDVTFNRWQKSKGGMSLDVIENLKVPVVLGHYHNQSSTKNCRYLGTLFQHSFGEFGFRKGFWTYDKPVGFVFHEQTTLPRHCEIEYIQEGRKQPSFVVSDGIDSDLTTTDYDVIRGIVASNHVKFTAKNYNIETKYLEVCNDLKSIAYSEFVPVSSKNLIKSIEAAMEISSEEADLGITNDSTLEDIVVAYMNSLPDTLGYKAEMIAVMKSKIESIGA
jgi:hypothetical protein